MGLVAANTRSAAGSSRNIDPMSSTESPDTATAALPVPPAGPGRRGAAEAVRTVTRPGLTLSVRAPAGRPEGPDGVRYGTGDESTAAEREPALCVHGLVG